jgi:hypothetical protein
MAAGPALDWIWPSSSDSLGSSANGCLSDGDDIGPGNADGDTGDIAGGGTKPTRRGNVAPALSEPGLSASSVPCPEAGFVRTAGGKILL